MRAGLFDKLLSTSNVFLVRKNMCNENFVVDIFYNLHSDEEERERWRLDGGGGRDSRQNKMAAPV